MNEAIAELEKWHAQSIKEVADARAGLELAKSRNDGTAWAWEKLLRGKIYERDAFYSELAAQKGSV